jgi:NDP-sugar pyrophosphorylase family protein
MKAMILAAGEGTRLRPLTDVCAKALVPVVNEPVMERTIRLLRIHGVQEIIVNACHHHQKIVDYLDQGNHFGVKIEVRVEKEILGTGGGIKNTQGFWGGNPFIVINGDILTDINLREVYESHRERDNLITMVLHDFPVHNKIRVDREMNILSIGPGSNIKGALAFTGIHIINPEVLDFIPENRNYDILRCYRKLIDLKKPARGYLATGHRWIDIGTLDEYVKANIALLPPERIAIGSECRIEPGARLRDWAVIGERATIKRDAQVKRSVLWADVVVGEGVNVVDSIVTTGVVLEKDLLGRVATTE